MSTDPSIANFAILRHLLLKSNSMGTLFLPELGDEVLVTFEEGDSERPYVVGSAWNGVHQPPATGFHSPGEVNGSEFAQNYIKRIVTKSGHRITLVDTPGKETISIATPTNNRIMLTESHADTGGRPAIVLESAGDIVLAAPNGRIHTQSMHRSAEVGVSGTTSKAAGAAGKAPAALKTSAPADSGSSSTVAKAAAPATTTKSFDCKGNWSSAVSQVNKTDDIADPLQRNKQITADYANLYKQTPDLQWAGLASVVSRNAGCGMVKAKGVADQSDKALKQEYEAPIIDPMGGPPADLYNSGRGVSAHIAYDALGNTNQTIYRTVGPTMTFVSQHGAKQLKACTASKAIPTGDPLAAKVPNNKLDNSVMPSGLSPAVDQLAAAENMPQGSAERTIANRNAADEIANYEQTKVVQQRIYEGHPELQGVMWANQKLSGSSFGRSLGAVPPQVALSADCNSTNLVPLNGSINDPAARVKYYSTLMDKFSEQNPSTRNNLIDALSKKPGF